jgi:hypothetical protein
MNTVVRAQFQRVNSRRAEGRGRVRLRRVPERGRARAGIRLPPDHRRRDSRNSPRPPVAPVVQTPPSGPDRHSPPARPPNAALHSSRRLDDLEIRDADAGQMVETIRRPAVIRRHGNGKEIAVVGHHRAVFFQSQQHRLFLLRPVGRDDEGRLSRNRWPIAGRFVLVLPDGAA